MTAAVAIGVGLRASGALELRHAEALTALDHHRAVVRELRNGPLAPLRFGRGMDAASVSLHEAPLRQVLSLASDHVEIGCRFTPRQTDEPVRAGRGWLRAAATRQRAADALAGRLERILSVVMVRDLGPDGDIRRFALCVPRAAAIAVVAALPLAAEGYTVDTSGPWPLYSFMPSEVRP
jgi:hypothetical protein